jgi:hypothetical protein
MHGLERSQHGRRPGQGGAGLRPAHLAQPRLQLYCNQVTDVYLAQLAEGCGQLTSLSLYDCDQVTDEGVAAIAREGLTIKR